MNIKTLELQERVLQRRNVWFIVEKTTKTELSGCQLCWSGGKSRTNFRCFMQNDLLSGLFPTKDMQTPPLPSVLILLLWKMRNVLNRMKNNFPIFMILIFRVIVKNSSKIGIQKWSKMNITRKIKIGKILNLIFLSIQHIPHLSCKFEHS